MTGPIDGDALLAKVKPKTREVRVQVCLRPDLVDEWERLNEALLNEQAKTANKSSGRLASLTPESVPPTPEAKQLANAIKKVEAQIEEASPWMTFHGLTKPQYEALTTEHPPRKDNQLDMLRGYDANAVSEAVVRRCLVDPVFSDEGFLALQASIGPQQWTELVNGANDACEGAKAPGKSELASLIRSKRGVASE